MTSLDKMIVAKCINKLINLILWIYIFQYVILTIIFRHITYTIFSSICLGCTNDTLLMEFLALAATIKSRLVTAINATITYKLGIFSMAIDTFLWFALFCKDALFPTLLKTIGGGWGKVKLRWGKLCWGKVNPSL